MAMHLGELILYVKDMAAQATFYREVLSLKQIFPNNDADLSDEYWVVFDTGACKLCLHAGGSGDFGEDAPRVVFFVEDLVEWQSKLTNQGVSAGPIRSPAPGVHVFDFLDPEGNRLSLEQSPSRE